MRVLSAPSWFITGVIALSGLAAALNQTLVIPLLPGFPQALGITGDDAGWLITVTLMVGAVSVPIMSRFADMFGKRRALVASMAILVIGSVVSALGTDFVVLLIGRGLSGFGMTLIPIGISVLRDVLPSNRLGTAVALQSATLSIGGAIGMPLAGVLNDSLGWASVFWVTAGVTGILLVATVVVVPVSPIRAGGRFDYIGAICFAIVIAALLLTISKGRTWGWTSTPILGCIALVIAGLAFWIPLQFRKVDPLVDLRSTLHKPVMLTNVSGWLVGFGMFVNSLIAMQQLQLPRATGYGMSLSVSESALWLFPIGIATVFLAPVNGYLLGRFGGKVVLGIGAVISILGFFLRIISFGTPLEITIGYSVTTLGVSLAYAAMPMLIMSAVPQTETASANGFNALIRMIGTSTASATVAAVLAGSIMVNGVLYPTWSEIAAVNILALILMVFVVVLAFFLPRQNLR